MELLTELEADQMVYLGTNNGSGWIVIEPAGYIIEKIDDLEKYLHDRVKNALAEAEYDLKIYPKIMVDRQEKIKELIESNGDKKKIKSEENMLRESERKFWAAYNKREKNTKFLTNWIHVSERKVKETYENGDEKYGVINGYAIKVEGAENGELWFRHEKKII